MQAYGNDYVYIDAIHQELPDLSRLAQFVSDRHFAIGSDGMVLICPSEKADFRMRMFNPDGTEGEMCGNALRSVGKYVYDHKLTDKTNLVIETLGGMQRLELFIEDDKAINIKADIGEPRLSTTIIPVNSLLPEFVEQPIRVKDIVLYITAVSWGNPHCVAFVDNVADFDVHGYGCELEHMTNVFPNKTNVTFAQIVNRDYIKMREWERGTGETIGCGTGCCTAVTAGVLTDRCNRHVSVEQIGGVLDINWSDKDGHMYMTGISNTVFEASIDIAHLNIRS